MADTINPRATYDTDKTADDLFNKSEASKDSTLAVAAGLFALAGSIERVAGAIKTAGGDVSRETAFVAEMIGRVDVASIANAIQSIAETMGNVTTTEEG